MQSPNLLKPADETLTDYDSRLPVILVGISGLSDPIQPPQPAAAETTTMFLLAGGGVRRYAVASAGRVVDLRTDESNRVKIVRSANSLGGAQAVVALNQQKPFAAGEGIFSSSEAARDWLDSPSGVAWIAGNTLGLVLEVRLAAKLTK